MSRVIAEVDILASPRWFPLTVLVDNSVRVLHLDQAAYQAASFLDERLLKMRPDEANCGLRTLNAAAARLSHRAHYIFHTGHVGSTLISRLIGAHPNFFSVREPALLRLFADAPTLELGAADRNGTLNLQAVLALLGRTWRADQRVVLKATSIVNDIAGELMAAGDQPSAILMFTTPVAYLCGIMAGPNSRVEARLLAPSRLRRLTRRLGGAAPGLIANSEGEWVAMNWLCEMAALHETSLRFGSQILWVDFDVFLREPAAGLEAIFSALGAASAAATVETLVSGPLMRQYSKAPEHAYDAALRRQVLQSAEREHGAEIRRGMAWLHSAAMRYPLVAAVLESREK
jgi:hypothetical protein